MRRNLQNLSIGKRLLNNMVHLFYKIYLPKFLSIVKIWQQFLINFAYTIGFVRNSANIAVRRGINVKCCGFNPRRHCLIKP